jgi:hypothetical protein
MFNGSGGRWLASISQVTQRCYATVYNNGSSSASHASARGDCADLQWGYLSTPKCRPKTVLTEIGAWSVKLMLGFASHSWLQSPQDPIKSVNMKLK